MKNPANALLVLAVLLVASCADLSKPDRFGNVYSDSLDSLKYKSTYPLGGYTYATSSSAHGIQIEYFTEDGRNYLWYPTGSRSLPGTWRKNDWGHVCFAYGQASYNPATKEHSAAGQEKCLRSYQQGTIISRVEGDPFNLESGELPDFDLTKCRLPEPMTLATTHWSCEPREAPSGLPAVEDFSDPVTPEELHRAKVAHFACLIQRAFELDDLQSDPNLIADRVERACRTVGEKRTAAELSVYRSMSADFARRYAERVHEVHMRDALEAVLHMRRPSATG